MGAYFQFKNNRHLDFLPSLTLTLKEIAKFGLSILQIFTLNIMLNQVLKLKQKFKVFEIKNKRINSAKITKYQIKLT